MTSGPDRNLLKPTENSIDRERVRKIRVGTAKNDKRVERAQYEVFKMDDLASQLVEMIGQLDVTMQICAEEQARNNRSLIGVQCSLRFEKHYMKVRKPALNKFDQNSCQAKLRSRYCIVLGISKSSLVHPHEVSFHPKPFQN